MSLLELTESEINAIIDPDLQEISKPSTILEETINSIPTNKLKPDYIKTHFSEITELIAKNAYSKFRTYQNRASHPIIQSFMEKYQKHIKIETDEKKLNSKILKLLKVFVPLIQRFELRASNMRKSRAGSTFEYILEYLLQKIEIPCERTADKNKKKLNRMDIVSPNEEVALKTPDKAKFISCKHTLRERWKQVIPEQGRNWTMYLITLDDSLPDKKARDS